MITMETADNALKTFYLDAVKEALDLKANPLLAKLERTSANVVGKDVRKLVKAGMNGGIGAGTETGDLPTAINRKGYEFVATLKNLYGTIEISDKALRAASSNEGAFVNVLNEEMQALIKSASLNFGRMLFGDGSGLLGSIGTITDDGTMFSASNFSNFVEGMVVEMRKSDGSLLAGMENCVVVGLDREHNIVQIAGGTLSGTEIPSGTNVYLKGSKGLEITGLAALFSDQPIYGVDRNKDFMKPVSVQSDEGEFSDMLLQKTLDQIEEISGAKTNLIVCSWGVRRAIIKYYADKGVNLETVTLEDGTKALSVAGIPLVADRFCPRGTIYLLNTNDFKIHQLCDWKWLEGEDGKILKQIPGKPVYTATLVKYAELMCENPCGQGCITAIREI